MKKRSHKKNRTINPPVLCKCEIDYEKLADAIVRAKKQASDDRLMVLSADKTSAIKKILQIVRGKRDTQTTFTVGLFSLILSLFCKSISLLIGVCSVVAVIYGFATINWISGTIGEIAMGLIFTLMLFVMGVMLTLIFHVVSVEMEKTNDKNVIFQAFSGMVSLVALIVALVALYK